MKRLLLSALLLAGVASPASAQLQRTPNSYMTGPIVNCTALDGSGAARCVLPGVVLYNPDGSVVSLGGSSGGTGVDPRVAQGSTTNGQTGILTQCAVVTGNQAYTAGQTNPCNLTPTGRLKVGLGAAGNVDHAAQLSTTIDSLLMGAKYYGAAQTWAAGDQGALSVDAAGNLLTNVANTVGVNNAQIGGTAIATGTGASNTGTQRVAVASDSTIGVTGSINDFGLVATAAPALTSGSTAQLSLTTAGGLRVDLAAGGTGLTASTNSNGAIPISTQSLNVNAIQRCTANGTSTSQLQYDVVSAPSTGANVCAVGVIPTAAAAQGVSPATVASVTSQVAKASAGNLYGLNVDNAAVAGTYAIAYNATAAPASGATLTASLILWHFLLPNGATTDKVFPVPAYASNGIVILYSTSLTTFTAPGTAPLASTVMFK